MISLKAKTLSLPHLSLSRTSSPSRKDSSRPATPAPLSPLTTATPSFSTTPGPVSPIDTPPTSASSSPGLKPKRSNSPKTRAVDSAAAGGKDAKQPRRSSIGASIAAFTSRTASPSTTAVDSTMSSSLSVPSGLTLTPATTTQAVSGRSTSDDKSGLRPLRSLSNRGKGRSQSSVRAQDVPAASSAAATAAVQAVATKDKKGGGMMGSVRRGFAAVPRSTSQNAARDGASGVPTPGAGSPVLGSGTATPAQAYAHANGALPTPIGGGGGGVQLHQLAESYVGKVSLRLGEAVNKVFLPIPHGPGGMPNKEMEKAEGPYGGTIASWKGRSAPRVMRAREVGDLIATELQAALHDPYLLRTLLRSSVLKALSLFLTRLSALLLLPSPSDPSLAPAVFNPPHNLKEADALPLPLRYNLQIVRCAYEVKRALATVADPHAGFPVFVEETLRPWRAKLAELMARVTTPFVGSARLLVAEACGRARIEGAVGSSTGVEAAGWSSLGLNGLPSPALPGVRATAASQLRSLSLGRASPAPLSGTTTPTTSLPGSAAPSSLAGPLWLRDLSALLDAFARVVARLECGSDADKWLVSIGTAVTWKGMLNCSARVIGVVGVPANQASPAESEKALLAPSPVLARKGFLGGVTVKKTPSPPASPPLPIVDLAGATASSATARLAAATSLPTSSNPSAADIAFVRLLSDLELLEARLQTFLVASLSTSSAVLSPAAPAATACPGGPSCGLCRTGRTFDDESSDSEDDEEDEHLRHHSGKRADPGRESRLAHSAMREAMQALSGLIVVVRASKDPEVIRKALETKPAEQKPVKEEKHEREGGALPLTPSALFATLSAAPAAGPASAPASTTSFAYSTVTLLPPTSSLSPECPTLHSALLELPSLVLLHLLASRVPPSSSFRLPHLVWALRGGWDEYASELRGFGAGEEWATEVAWEMGSEVERVTQEKEMGGVGWMKGEKEAFEALKTVVRRCGGERR